MIRYLVLVTFAMVLKISKQEPMSFHKSKSILFYSAGFTILELVVVFSCLALLSLIVLLIINPVKEKRKARDEVRLSDAVTLSRGIEEYILDNKVPPDSSGTLRVSNVLPAGSSGPLSNNNGGWIAANLTGFLVRLPIDPTNSGVYVYKYERSGSAYEISMVLEYYTSYMVSDGGNTNNAYEIGSSLTIIN